jgi:hypothetical protein
LSDPVLVGQDQGRTRAANTEQEYTFLYNKKPGF